MSPLSLSTLSPFISSCPFIRVPSRQVSQLPHSPLTSLASPSTHLRFACCHERHQEHPRCVSLHFDLVGRLLLEVLTASMAPLLRYALLVSELPTLMAIFSDDAFSVSFVGFLFLFPTLVQMVVLSWVQFLDSTCISRGAATSPVPRASASIP